MSREALLRQRRLQGLAAATARAMAGDAGLHFRGSRFYCAKRPVPIHAPHLQSTAEPGKFPALRALVDAVALRMQNSDASLHRALLPSRPVARAIFELLEQIRVESLVAPHMLGQQQNLWQQFSKWLDAFHHARHTESHVGLLLFTVAALAWTRLNVLPLDEAIDGVIESTRANLSPVIGAPLARLKRHRLNQRAYAVSALEIARVVDDLISRERITRNADENTDSPEEEITLAAFAFNFDEDNGGDEDGLIRVVAGNNRVVTEAVPDYRVYTRAYDVEALAGNLVRAAELKIWRQRMDTLVREQAVNVPGLARRLLAVLATRRPQGWNFGEEAGVIDGARLAQLVATPTEGRIFKQVHEPPQVDCSVSFLIDCSGSMKTHIESVAVLVDTLARALELIGAKSEILGYTTAAWNGGRALKDWLQAGKPAQPGRLNERSHLIFKSADQAWRHARPSIAALLKPELFREGIDGEAVEWASSRLLAGGRVRKILIVISDGCPMDGATQKANDRHYLDHHLREVVDNSRAAGVRLLGIGVGLDLSLYYRRSIDFDTSRKWDGGLFAALLGALAFS